MKLPGLKRDTQSALDRARADLAALATAIAELQQRRDVALAGDDGVDAAVAIDRQAHEQGLRLRAIEHKIARLEAQLADEQAEQARRDFVTAVAAIEPRLARRTEAAVKLEKALIAVGAAAEQFAFATEAVLRGWPETVPFPSTAYAGHALSLERLGAVMQQLFTPPRGHADRRPAQPAEFISRTLDLSERVRLAGFAATEHDLAAEWLADLRHAHDEPEPEPVEEQPAVESAA